EEQAGQEQAEPETAADDIKFVGFGRVFRGVLRETDLCIYRSDDAVDRHVVTADQNDRTSDPSDRGADQTRARLYLLMGHEIRRVACVPAGCIFGVAGLDHVIGSTATLTDSNVAATRLFRPMTSQASPILKVAVTPRRYAQMDRLVKGLKLLAQADSNVEVSVQETGEHVIVTTGELHLERCITDLKERFARGVHFRIGKPII
ncbi:MAG: hypothetical protein MHM6MM_009592, partial [Cercozoa sp. M6MM]